jgi:hypothetical protein
LKFPLYTGVPKLFCRFTTMPSIHTKHPGKKEEDAMWSLGMGGSAARQNWAAPAAPLAGEEVGEDEGLTMAPFVAGDGAVRPPVRWAAEFDGGCGWSSCSGKEDDGVGTPAARAGSGGRREGAWVVLWRRNHAGQGLGGRTTTLRLARGWPMCDLYSQGAATRHPTSMPWYSD